MNTDCGFGKYEGYVGNKEDFNGVIFYLKEPNTGGDEAKEFWFQRIITDKDNYYKNLEKELTEAGCKNVNTIIRSSKGTATRFENRFKEMLKQLGLNDKKLTDVVFCNVNSDSGDKTLTGEFKNKLATSAVCKLETIIKNMEKNELIVFTCKDIFNKLRGAWPVEAKEDGLRYNDEEKALRSFSHVIGNKKITVYEIYHPSYFKKVDLQKKKG
ncbi:MAG: hypothetical protein ACLRS1_11210 [Oscillospiraceae bacterium]